MVGCSTLGTRDCTAQQARECTREELLFSHDQDTVSAFQTEGPNMHPHILESLPQERNPRFDIQNYPT